MKRQLLGILVLLLLPATVRSQDKNMLFSQYRYNGLTLNPAYAGSHEVFSASFLGRHQWLGFEGAPKNYALNLHFMGKSTKTGWGANVLHESIGIRSVTGLYFNYAYRLMLGPGTLAMGLRAGMASGNQEVLNLDGGDPVFSENTDDYLLPNFGIGLYYKHRKAFAGLSIPFLMGYESNAAGKVVAYHSFSMYTYYLTAGVHFDLNRDWRLTPSALMQYERESGMVIDGTVNVLYREIFGAGLSYRSAGALVIMLNYRLNYQTTLGLAYDFGFGGFNRYNRNSVEIALQVDLGFKIDRSNPMDF